MSLGNRSRQLAKPDIRHHGLRWSLRTDLIAYASLTCTSMASLGKCPEKWERCSFVAASLIIFLSLLSAAWSRTQLFGPYPR